MGISNDIAPRKNKKHVFSDSNIIDIKEKSIMSNFEDQKDDSSPNDHIKVAEEDSSSDALADKKTEEENKIKISNDRQNDFFSSTETTKTAKKKPNPIWFLWSLFLILLAILVFQNFDRIKSLIAKEINSPVENSTSNETNSIVATQNTEDFYQSEEPATTDLSTNDSATTTPSATTPSQTTTNTAEINKSAIKISVLNGNGINGSASIVEKALEDAGFLVKNTGNAKKFTYSHTYIYHKTGKEAEANLVKAAISNRTIVLEKSDSIVGTYDIVIVVGKK